MSRFTKTFWTVIIMEFLERGSYYAMMSVLSVYLIISRSEGGLELSITQAGLILGTIPPLVYFLPVLSGAIAEKIGYRNVLFFAFTFMLIGYSICSISSNFVYTYFSLIMLAIGAGFFKPIISGSIAKTTTKETSALGFGIYYWSINLGAFLFPLILVPILKSYGYSNIFLIGSVSSVLMLVINLILFKEPLSLKEYNTITKSKSFSSIFVDMSLVLKDWRFILLIVIYSGFWVLYFQMYGTVLWYLKDFINTDSISDLVNNFLKYFVSDPNWKFDIEHVTVINAGVIISLQLVVSNILKKTKALPTMVAGVTIGTIGMAILSISATPWIFITGIMIFTFGEMVTHPKFISYIGEIAPEDKKALYMGYSFFYGVIGSSIGGFMGSQLYNKLIIQDNNPSALWIIFASIGVITSILLIVYGKYISVKKG